MEKDSTNIKSGKKLDVGNKSTVKINPSKESLKEQIREFAKENRELMKDKIINEGDYWHPDPDEDRKLSDRGAKLRAREDQAAKAKPQDDKKLRPGESYLDYSKRQGGSKVTKPAAKPSLSDRIKNKLGKAIDKIGGINNSFDPEGEVLESAVPGKPAERLGAVTAIPADEREAAKQRTLAKAAAKRKEREMEKEEFEIEEGKQAFPLKKVEKKMDAVRKETGYNKPGNPAVPQVSSSEMSARNRLHKLSGAYSKAKRVKQEADKASRSSTFFRDTHPTSQAKMKKSNEDFSVDQFDESRRMDREGVDRNDTARKNRTMAAKASLAAKQKRQTVLDKHEKKTGTKLDISRSKEGREHAAKFPGSRQEPKERGKKETPQETQNRRANRQVARVVKHGYTSKEKKDNAAMAKHTSRFD